MADLAALRPRCGDAVSYCTKMALRELGRRAEFLNDQIARLNELLTPLVAVAPPGLLALRGVGPDTAALLLITAGDPPERLRSEAAWAHMCGAAPIPAGSGKTDGRPFQPRRTASRSASVTMRRSQSSLTAIRPRVGCCAVDATENYLLSQSELDGLVRQGY